MFYDTKHLSESKVPIYAKNIINALLKAYGIKEKRELFASSGVQNAGVDNGGFGNWRFGNGGFGNGGFGNREFNRETGVCAFSPSNHRNNVFYNNNNNKNNNNNNNNNMFHNSNNDDRNVGIVNNIAMRDAMTQLTNILTKCFHIQR